MLTKVCTGCGVERGVDEYHKHKSCKHGVKAACKVCCKQYKEANKKAIAGRRKAYYQANKEAKDEQQRAYRQTNPHLVNALNAKRRASKLQATPAWANSEHIESLYLIASINREAGYDLHVDHIVPLQSDLVCGLHCEVNLQLLPAINNISKGNRHWPDMW